jgi:hypothetical protein
VSTNRVKLSGNHIGIPLIYIDELDRSAQGNFVIRVNDTPACAVEWSQDHPRTTDTLDQALNIAGISNTNGVRIVSEFLTPDSGLYGAKELLTMLLAIGSEVDASVVKWCFAYSDNAIPKLEICIPKCDSEVVKFDKPQSDTHLPDRISILDGDDITIKLDNENICVKELELNAERNLALTMLTQPWLVRVKIKYQGNLQSADFHQITIADRDGNSLLPAKIINLKPTFTSESWGGNSCIEFVAELNFTKQPKLL